MWYFSNFFTPSASTVASFSVNRPRAKGRPPYSELEYLIFRSKADMLALTAF